MSAFPPGPSRRYWGTSLLSIDPSPEKFLAALAEEYGDITCFKIGLRRNWIVSSPEGIRTVLVSQAGKFIKGRVLRRARWFLGEALLTSEGEVHRRQRRLTQPAFHRGRLEGYANTMVACATRLREQWREGEEVDISNEMMRLTLSIVGQTLFSADVQADAQKVGTALTLLIENLGRMLLPFSSLLLKLPLPDSQRLVAARGVLDETIYRLVNERRATGTDTGDLLSMLVFAEDADRPGERLSDVEVRDQVMTLFLAGHETTANALAWTCWLLSQNPQVEATLQEEVSRVLGDRTAGFNDLRALPYTEKVVRESLRLFPPVWTIGRLTVEDVVVENYTIPADSVVIVSPWVVHHDPRFFPEPYAFKPERWTPEFTAALPKFAYFPFGGGPRICIGENFAWMELILILATLRQRWRLEARPGAQPTALPRITLRMDNGFWMKPRRVPALGTENIKSR